MLSAGLSLPLLSRNSLNLSPLLNLLSTGRVAQVVASSAKAFSTTASNPKNANPLQLLAQLDVFEASWGLPSAAQELPVQSTVLGTAPEHPLMVYKAKYPPEVWSSITELFKGQKFPDVVDVDCTCGSSAVELARRGFRVLSIESSATLLARAHMRARALGVEMQLLGAERERATLHAGCADLFTVMHGFHLLDVPSALAEAHRVLRPRGYVVAAWNDRHIESPFMEELEEILEAYNPNYNRALKQRDPEEWVPKLTQGGLFDLHQYGKHLHTIQLSGFKEFTGLVHHLHALKDLVEGSEQVKKSVRADLRALVLRHCGSLDNIPLHMETELYMLVKN